MAPSRREFLKSSTGALALCCGVLLGGTSTACTSVRYVSFTEEAQTLLINKADMLDDRFVLIKHSKLDSPIYLRKITDTHYRAFLMYCTHKGCEVKPAGNILVCPCHGSQFSGVGKVLSGPADENLHEFKVTLREDKIAIAIS